MGGDAESTGWWLSSVHSNMNDWSTRLHRSVDADSNGLISPQELASFVNATVSTPTRELLQQGPTLSGLLVAIKALSAILVVGAMLVSTRWLLWLLISMLIGTMQLAFALWQGARISLSIFVLGLLTMTRRLLLISSRLVELMSCRRCHIYANCYREMHMAGSYEEWKRLAELIEFGHLGQPQDGPRRPSDPGDPLVAMTAQLESLRRIGNVSELMFTLSGLCLRDFFSFDALGTTGRAGVMPTEPPGRWERRLAPGALTGEDLVVGNFLEEVDRALLSIEAYAADAGPGAVCDEVLSFLDKAQMSLGRSALCLSGGGSLAMYHMGVVRALILQNILPPVISGTSGGSIVAGMLAIKTDREMLDEVCVEEISTNYGFDGTQERLNVRWFPPLSTQVFNFIRNGVLADNAEFERTTRFYYGDATFAEAYAHTGRHCCIGVSASRLPEDLRDTVRAVAPNRLLCSHVSTPHVLVRSAVAASCALPGIMRPNRLLVKDSRGRIRPFSAPSDWALRRRRGRRHGGGKTDGGGDSGGGSDDDDDEEEEEEDDDDDDAGGGRRDGMGNDGGGGGRAGAGTRWIDGSIRADLPFERLAQLFNVSTYVVSQVNPHVVPFVKNNDDGRSGGGGRSSSRVGSVGRGEHGARVRGKGAAGIVVTALQKLEGELQHDVSDRLRTLSRLGLLPRLFGQDIGGVFKQRYQGHVTIVPSFSPAEAVGLKAVLNPTVDDMKRYLHGGMRATFPHIAQIRNSTHMERSIRRTLRRCYQQLGACGGLRGPQHGRSVSMQMPQRPAVATSTLPHDPSPSQGPRGAAGDSSPMRQTRSMTRRLAQQDRGLLNVRGVGRRGVRRSPRGGTQTDVVGTVLTDLRSLDHTDLLRVRAACDDRLRGLL